MAVSFALTRHGITAELVRTEESGRNTYRVMRGSWHMGFIRTHGEGFVLETPKGNRAVRGSLIGCLNWFHVNQHENNF